MMICHFKIREEIQMKEIKPTFLYSLNDIARLLGLTPDSYKKTKLYKKLIKCKQPGNLYLGMDILYIMSSNIQNLIQIDRLSQLDSDTRIEINKIIEKRKIQNAQIATFGVYPPNPNRLK